MFYQQNINNIKLVILSLDGGLLKLNKLRYNYFKKICLSYDQDITKDDFSLSIGNMNTMYDCSPIQEHMTNSEVNQVIERDLFEYCKIKPDIAKEGVEELLQFFKQRHIKIAVVSTHKSKRAIQYLQLAKIYKYVDFLIGGDCELSPIPDPSIFIETAKQVHVDIEETLVIADSYQFVLAANRAMSNVIYISDLVSPTSQIKKSVFKCVRNNLEIINIFLFSKYETAELFSPILGMSADMDYDTLQDVYHKLMMQYQDDSQLQSIVESVYHHYLNQLRPQDELMEDALISAFEDHTEAEESVPVEETQEDNTRVDKPLFEFNDEPIEDSEEQPQEEPSTPEINIPLVPPVQEETKPQPIEQIEEPEYTPDAYSTTSAITIDTNRMNELIDVINGDVVSEEKETEELPKTEKEDSNEEMTKLDHIIGFVYYFISNVIFAVVAMIIYIPLEDFIEGDGLFNSLLKGMIDFYMQLIDGFYGLIFNGLHALLSFIPNYSSLTTNNGILSNTAIMLFLCILFNLLICYIIKGIYHLISQQLDD